MEAPDFAAFDYKYMKGCDENSCHAVELSYIFGSFKNAELLDPSLGNLEVSEDILALRIDFQHN